MLAHIIHHEAHTDREQTMHQEMKEQAVRYTIWPAIMHDYPPTGISQAHKQIIRHAKINALPMVLVMEDDIQFVGTGAYDRFLQQLPADFDLYLGGISYGTIYADGTAPVFSGTHLYICHERFYDRFLAADEKKNIDEALWRQGKYVVCQPIAAIQYPGYSYQKREYVDYTASFSKYLSQ